jgi:hypothetical protein
VVPKSEVDADESAVNLMSNIYFVMSYMEPILAVDVAVVVVMPATEEP